MLVCIILKRIIETFITYKYILVRDINWGVIIIKDHINSSEETTNRLQSSYNELQALNATISHEIKAPVRAIDGYARIFLEDYGDSIDNEGTDLILNIRTICSDTLTLINKLLDYTHFAEAEPIQEAIDLSLMIKDVFNELTLRYCDNKAIKLNMDKDIPFILADKILIKQVLINIISNSLKFTSNKEVSVITIGYEFKNDENIFYIKDNGVGFDMKFSENLFGMFQRMHSIDDFEGSGVGLAIVKKIIQKFGGKVWITGEVGKGACVYFTIAPQYILK